VQSKKFNKQPCTGLSEVDSSVGPSLGGGMALHPKGASRYDGAVTVDGWLD